LACTGTAGFWAENKEKADKARIMAATHGSAARSRLRETAEPTAQERYVPAHGTEALGTAGVCIALGIVLPFFVHPFGISPRVILPMHFPVFLAGVLLSPWYAALVGVMAPALSSGFTGMPTAAQVIRLIPELATYGALTSLLLRLFPVVPGLPERSGRIGAIALAMLVAMIAGRLVYVGVSALTAGLEELNFYLLILVLPGIPGMVAQLILVPPLAYRLQKTLYRA
jgi:hypothetical protein